MTKIQFRNEDCLTTINKIKEQGKKLHIVKQYISMIMMKLEN